MKKILGLILVVSLILWWFYIAMQWDDDAFVTQSTEELDDFLASLDLQDTVSISTTSTSNSTQLTPVRTIWTSEYDAFLETAYVYGNQDASISIIEFADMQCPFCKRQMNNGTLDQVKEKYGDDINIVFGHFPLSFHPNAQKAGEALECAGKLWGNDLFFAFKKAYLTTAWNANMEIAKEVAAQVGLDADALISCVDWWEFAQKVKNHRTFGQSLGVTGTPWNIVVNNQTLETVKVLWAVPASIFDAPITSFLWKQSDSENPEQPDYGDNENNSEFSCDNEQKTWVPKIECEALVDLYNSTDGKNWDSSEFAWWLDSDTSIDQWKWVLVEDWHIVMIWLHGTDLFGFIPESIWDLERLNTLYLTRMNLSWPIPESIWNLENLESLALSWNNLSWTIPESIWNLENLKELVLHSNNLSWPIPDSIWNLENLEGLHLTENNLSWYVPESVWNLVTKSTWMTISENNLCNISLEIDNNIHEEQFWPHTKDWEAPKLYTQHKLQTPKNCNIWKVNDYDIMPNIYRRLPDPDGTSWAELVSSDTWKLLYCQKFYTWTVEIDIESDKRIGSRCERNLKNCVYWSTQPVFSCIDNSWNKLGQISYRQGKVNMHTSWMNQIWNPNTNKNTRDEKPKELIKKPIDQPIVEKKPTPDTTPIPESSKIIIKPAPVSEPAQPSSSWWKRYLPNKYIAYCGNDTVDEWEECDDGWQRDGDGCDRYCILESWYPTIIDQNELNMDQEVLSTHMKNLSSAYNFRTTRLLTRLYQKIEQYESTKQIMLINRVITKLGGIDADRFSALDVSKDDLIHDLTILDSLYK